MVGIVGHERGLDFFGGKAERVVASNLTYGETEMAWTERSEVKVDGGFSDLVRSFVAYPAFLAVSLWAWF